MRFSKSECCCLCASSRLIEGVKKIADNNDTMKLEVHVEVVEEVDDEIREKGLQMGITFGEPDIFRHV